MTVVLTKASYMSIQFTLRMILALKEVFFLAQIAIIQGFIVVQLVSGDLLEKCSSLS